MPGILPVYMRAHCKTGLVAARTGALTHVPGQFRTAFSADGSAHFRAEYLCGGGTARAVVLASRENAPPMCAVCEDAVKGPCVYRCFDPAGRLLYIGSAEARLKRFKRHESQTPWWPEVADTRAEYFPTVLAAKSAERLAIIAETPLYNTQYRRSA